MLSRIGATEVGRRKLRRQSGYEGPGTDLADVATELSASAPISWYCCIRIFLAPPVGQACLLCAWGDVNYFAILGIGL